MIAPEKMVDCSRKNDLNLNTGFHYGVNLCPKATMISKRSTVKLLLVGLRLEYCAVNPAMDPFRSCDLVSIAS
ncbi:hypothetical protein T265_12132 [Opisthorchis viverrini]|uniref:Uncharacterized protein n=1 Tax=Opisthorchis viverrini TaxID=6198 RepID=A0A074ZUH0_OPIVI|nr:hypothetical protein T265_12132 [Opisthorchis viverrini]KER18844.1 hypothetical protein T265_12132 [Opisthorchis viverrini]